MGGRCVLLTTHSMEECEALCHRICIMNRGQIQCLGTPQHLKSKFGHGFQLDVMLKAPKVAAVQLVDGEEVVPGDLVGDQVSVQRALQSEFRASLIEQNQNKLVFDIQFEDGRDVTLAAMFRILEKMKEDLHVESYALSQATLEQVFIKMAAGNAVPNDMDGVALDAKTSFEKKRQ